MPDFQTFVAILAALLVFLTGVLLSYETIEFRNYQFPIPQWTGLLVAGITFIFVAVDQFLRGLIRLEEIQRRTEEEQRRVQERDRSLEEEQRRTEEEQRRIEERHRSLEAAERETRRTRIEARYRIAIARFQLNPDNIHRRQLVNMVALLEEYLDTL
jgi:hypothetical protein